MIFLEFLPYHLVQGTENGLWLIWAITVELGEKKSTVEQDTQLTPFAHSSRIAELTGSRYRERQSLRETIRVVDSWD